MATVRMLINITGARDGVPWPEVGGTIDVPDAEAENLVANGYAEPEESDAPKPKATRGRGKKAAADSDDVAAEDGGPDAG